MRIGRKGLLRCPDDGANDQCRGGQTCCETDDVTLTSEDYFPFDREKRCNANNNPVSNEKRYAGDIF